MATFHLIDINSYGTILTIVETPAPESQTKSRLLSFRTESRRYCESRANCFRSSRVKRYSL